MTQISNTEQKNGISISSGSPLTWPISEELLGRKARFDGYVTGAGGFWDYVVGKEYEIKRVNDRIGPANIRGAVPTPKYYTEFKFTLLPEQTAPDGCYHDDEEDKLKPLKPQSDQQQIEAVTVTSTAHDVHQDRAAMEKLVKAVNRFNEKSKPDTVNYPPYYQTEDIECVNTIRASLGLDGFVAFCRGKAIEHVSKRDCSAQDLRKAVRYLHLAANEII